MDHERLASTNPAPTTSRDRFQSIDTLRGFALLGILVPNIVAFAWPMNAMTDPLTIGDSPANNLAHFITTGAFLGKFMFLFALLFGSGVIMYARKFDTYTDEVFCKQCRYDLAGLSKDSSCPECNSTDRTNPFLYHTKLRTGASLWYFRCGILLMFGLLHAYGLWYGDILTYYAIAGLTLLWWVRRLNPKLQFFGGLALYYLGSLLLIGLTILGYWAVSAGEMKIHELSGDPAIEILGYTGTYFEAFKTRFFATIYLHALVFPLMIPMFWGMMSMGMGLTRMGILTGERSLGFYVKAAIICLAIGIPTTALAHIWINQTFDLIPGFLWQAFAQPIGVPLAFGYGALVIALSKWAPARFICTPLAAVGRMALTNYFLQTILCTTLFYGYGLGYFASIEYPQLWLVVLGVWTINILFSLLWLRFFTMGPFEWLWRCLTYRQFMAIRA